VDDSKKQFVDPRVLHRAQPLVSKRLFVRLDQGKFVNDGAFGARGGSRRFLALLVVVMAFDLSRELVWLGVAALTVMARALLQT